jgi:hypothetical protein
VPAGEQQRRRARQLALSMLELGEDYGATERQLLRWRYPSALARDALLWAAAQRRWGVCPEDGPDSTPGEETPAGEETAALDQYPA